MGKEREREGEGEGEGRGKERERERERDRRTDRQTDISGRLRQPQVLSRFFFIARVINKINQIKS